MKARDFIKPGENIIVIFTEGILLEFGDDNTGLTGDWTIDPNHSIDRVIIYWRIHESGYPPRNTLYIANHAGVIFVEEKEGHKRYKIKLAHIQYIGETKLMWDKFADTGANPIRYLSKNG